jgi:arylsulfatase I/J
VKTEHLDQLVKEGIELDHAYTYKFCAPSRSALQSGRFPTHVTVLNRGAADFNPNNTVSGFAGIPRNMTGIAALMRRGGYATHQTGKWDAGMATHDHTPLGRGYDSSLGYFHHANDYWTEHATDLSPGEGDFVDLWRTDRPAHDLNGTRVNASSTGVSGALEDYEEFKFLSHVLSTIRAHDPATPLFYNYDFHIVHEPMEVPGAYHRQFDFMAADAVGDYKGHRQTYVTRSNMAVPRLLHLENVVTGMRRWSSSWTTRWATSRACSRRRRCTTTRSSSSSATTAAPPLPAPTTLATTSRSGARRAPRAPRSRRAR